MGLVLFDWKTSGTTKNIVKPLFIRVFLFDGYLTETTSYPHLIHLAYLINNVTLRLKRSITNLLPTTYLFDGYLTEN